MNRSVNDYNRIINDFKHDVKIQKEINVLLKNIKKDYLKTGLPGNTKNVYNKL